MASNHVQFEDNSVAVKTNIKQVSIAFLYEAAELLKGQTAQNTPVKTGQLKGSWDYSIDEAILEASIGSPLENAIWNEFGTGEYALNGDGRKGGWSYKDEKGNWIHTLGKHPRRTLWNSFNSKKNSIIKRANTLFGGISK